jgi:hypothetical protein
MDLHAVLTKQGKIKRRLPMVDNAKFNCKCTHACLFEEAPIFLSNN